MGGASILKTRMLAQMCKKSRKNRENILCGAERPGGARPKAAPMFSCAADLVVVCVAGAFIETIALPAE